MHNYADTDIYHLFQSIFTKDWEVGRERLSFIKKLTFLAQACRLSISFQIEIIAITFCHFFFGSFHRFESVHSHPNHHFLLIVS